jgi:hypothetical protein
MARLAQFEERGQRVRNLGKERGRKLQASAALFDVGVDSRLDPNMSAREVPCVHMCRRGAQCQRLRDEFNQSGVSVRVCLCVCVFISIKDRRSVSRGHVCGMRQVAGGNG